jgi:lysophospholipase L1-like esterase
VAYLMIAAGAVLIVVILLLVSRRAIGMLRRPPANSVAAFLADGTRDRPVVEVIGASTVHGNTGFDFVAELARRRGDEFVFVNAGCNGDTSEKVLARLDPVIEVQPDFAVVLVGGNDLVAIHQLLIPAIGRTPSADPPSLQPYAETLTTIVKRLRSETRATVALMAISIVGENLDSRYNRYADELNAVMRQVADEQGLDFLPFNDVLKDDLRAAGAAHGKDFVDSSMPMFRSIWLHHTLGVSFDRISRHRGYRLLVDGMHLNSRGGRIAADQIEAWLDGVRRAACAG